METFLTLKWEQSILKNNNVKFIGDPQKRIEEDYLTYYSIYSF